MEGKESCLIEGSLWMGFSFQAQFFDEKNKKERFLGLGIRKQMKDPGNCSFCGSLLQRAGP